MEVWGGREGKEVGEEVGLKIKQVTKEEQKTLPLYMKGDWANRGIFHILLLK